MALEQTPPRFFIVAHNRNHVSIFTDMAKLVRDAGVQTTFVVVDGNPDRDAAAGAIEKIGFPFFESAQLMHIVTPRDVVALGNDWGPKHFIRKLETLRRRGVPIVGIVEGARFAYPRHWEHVDDLLVWGQSGVDTLPGRKHIVGSPAIERAMKPERAPAERPRVLVNYKFMKGAKDQGPIWARECAGAASPVDPDYVICAHPFNAAELGGLSLSHEPFTKLLNNASLLITRSSTVIYEALASRVSVIYYPLADERRAEFGEPMGAFGTATNAAELADLVRAHSDDPTFNAETARAFMERHVSIDPARPAPRRMADFILAKLQERASIDASALPGSKRGLLSFLSFGRAGDTAN
jgi:hypothetical protein